MAMEKLYRYIQQKVTILELLLFLVVGLSASAVYLSSDGIKPAFGIYEVQEIELHKSYFRVVGRTYARSLLIDRQNQRYKGSCVGLSDTICTIRDNRDFFANKLQFLRLNKEKEIGVVLYVEGLDLITKREFVIDNRANREELIQRYRQRQLKLSIMVFSFLICPLVLGLLKFLAHRKGY